MAVTIMIPSISESPESFSFWLISSIGLVVGWVVDIGSGAGVAVALGVAVGCEVVTGVGVTVGAGVGAEVGTGEGVAVG
jgi:hypothetical protein